MEHARRFDGIQAGHAGNVGKLLQQYLMYAATHSETDRHEATLTICTLHSLHTPVRRAVEVHAGEPACQTSKSR